MSSGSTSGQGRRGRSILVLSWTKVHEGFCSSLAASTPQIFLPLPMPSWIIPLAQNRRPSFPSALSTAEGSVGTDRFSGPEVLTSLSQSFHNPQL